MEMEIISSILFFVEKKNATLIVLFMDFFLGCSPQQWPPG